MYLKQRYSNYYLMGVYTDEKQRQERLLNNKKDRGRRHPGHRPGRAAEKIQERIRRLQKQKFAKIKTINGEPHTGEESKILPRLFQRILDQELEQVLPFIIQNVSSCLESADIFINNSRDNSAHLNLKYTLVRYISFDDVSRACATDSAGTLYAGRICGQGELRLHIAAGGRGGHGQ